MNFLEAVILGIVEGITEFLPVSSTGHLILTSSILNLQESEFLKSFEICVQIGAILAVLCVYWKRLLTAGSLYKKLGLACLPVFSIGLVLYKLVKHYLLGNNMIVLGGLFFGGIFMIIFEIFHRPRREEVSLGHITYRQALGIGFCQILAIIPGVSRSASTILSGMAFGLDRKTAAEFSFLLAIPVLCAATALDLLKSGYSFTQSQWITLGIGLVSAFIMALAAIHFLIRFIARHSFIWFGLYRIIAVCVFWIFV